MTAINDMLVSHRTQYENKNELRKIARELCKHFVEVQKSPVLEAHPRDRASIGDYVASILSTLTRCAHPRDLTSELVFLEAQLMNPLNRKFKIFDSYDRLFTVILKSAIHKVELKRALVSEFMDRCHELHKIPLLKFTVFF